MAALLACLGCEAKGRYFPVAPKGSIVQNGVKFVRPELSATFSPRTRWIRVRLVNRAEYQLRFLWDGARFVDQQGRSWPVKVVYVRRLKRSPFQRNRNAQIAPRRPVTFLDDAPEILGPGARLEALIIPKNNIWPERGLVLLDRKDRGVPLRRLSLSGRVIRPILYGRMFSVILVVEGRTRTRRLRYTFKYVSD